MPQYIESNAGLLQSLIAAQNASSANKTQTTRSIAEAVAGAINKHYESKEMQITAAKEAKTKEIMGAIEYLAKNNLLKIPESTTGDISVEGYQPIPTGMQEMLKSQGISSTFSQPREKAIDVTVTPEQYTQVLTQYKDKPEVAKRLLTTTQPGMKYTDFVKSVQVATKEPITGLRPGQQSAEFKSEKDLRSEFENMTKEFRLVENNMNRIKASVTEPSAAGDLALIYNYMKMLDPTSVVREGEFATAAAAGSYGERIKAQVNRLTKGERLSEEIRNDFVKRANELYKSQLEQYDITKQTYTGLAKDYGLDPKKIVIDVSGRLGEKKPIAKPSTKPAPKDEIDKALDDVFK